MTSADDPVSGYLGAGEALGAGSALETRAGGGNAQQRDRHSLIAYAEACAAFARYARFRRDKIHFQRLRRTLDRHWRQWDIVAADETLVRRAGELAGRYGLRGYDSMHLAAVEAVREASQGAEFLFGVFDADLAHAARLAGFSLLDY